MTCPPVLEIVDCHCGGDVSRVVVSGIVPLPGDSLAAQARYLERSADGLRRLLLSEPYGNPTMSVDLLVPPRTARADAGVVIMEAMGYPGFSGSNAICAAKVWLERSGQALNAGPQSLVLETPGAVVDLTADCRGGSVRSVSYQAPPAFVVLKGIGLDLPDHGPLVCDLVWGGVLYAVLPAAQLGLTLTREELPRLAQAGAAAIRALQDQEAARQASAARQAPLSFVLFVGSCESDSEDSGPGDALFGCNDSGDKDSGQKRPARRLRARQAAYVHPGVVCRSPTGTGTAAHLAWLADQAPLPPGCVLETQSPFETKFIGKIFEYMNDSGGAKVISQVSAKVHLVAHSQISIDWSDPLVSDGGLRAILAAAP